MKIIKPSATLEWVTPDALQMIERAGRTCYKSDCSDSNESNENFIRGIIKRGHESVLEHACASFRFVCDRGVTHELVRHRLVAYSQESTRYCNYGSDKFGGEITVIEPPALAQRRALWLEAMKNAEYAYLDMIKSSQSPQIARSVLPTCLKTEIVATTNFREWRHILRLRTSLKAHPQIREVMLQVLDYFRANYFVIVEDIQGA